MPVGLGKEDEPEEVVLLLEMLISACATARTVGKRKKIVGEALILKRKTEGVDEMNV